MLWPRWIVFNRRKIGYSIILAILMLVLIWQVSAMLNTATSARNLFNRSLEKTLACSSYRYTVEVRLDGRDPITLVEGERSESGSVHIKGYMQNSRMEFIQVGDTVYMKDPWSSRWFTLKGNSLAQTELFAAELNPTGLFVFKDVPVIKKTGTEKVDGYKTVVLEVRPIIANPFMELRYTDFRYRLWIDSREKLIRKASVYATTTESHGSLDIKIALKDFNKKILVTPPQKDLLY